MYKYIVLIIFFIPVFLAFNLQASQLPLDLTTAEKDLLKQYFDKECYRGEKPAMCSYVASQIETATDYKKIWDLLRSIDDFKPHHLAYLKKDLIHCFENRLISLAIHNDIKNERFGIYCSSKVLHLLFTIRDEQCIELLESLVKPVDQWRIDEKVKNQLVKNGYPNDPIESIRCEAFYILLHVDKEFFNNNCHIIVNLAEYLKPTKQYPGIKSLLDRQ